MNPHEYYEFEYNEEPYVVPREWFEEHNKQIRADVIDEHFSKIMSFINTNNRGNSDYFIVDQIENYIAEQLKEQNKWD